MSNIITSIPPRIEPARRPVVVPRSLPFELPKSCVGAYVPESIGVNQWNDISGNGNHGAITGAARTAKGRLGPAFDFGLNSDDTKYVNIAASQIIDLPATKTLSFVVWYKPNYAATAGKAVVSWGGTDDLIFYPNDPNNGNGPRLFWRNGFGGGSLDVNDGSDLNGLVTQSVFTAEAGEQIIYTNGVVAGSLSSDLSGAGPCDSFRIGNWADGSQPFGGLIDEVIIFNRVLTQNEITAIYEAGKP